MTNWKLTLEYDGTRYSGWQEQRNARTIQGELRKAAERILDTVTDLQGAGRTDAGVHALAHLRTPSKINRPEELLKELNQQLPVDIAVLAVEKAEARFHARHDALSRIYRYQISLRKTAFSKKYVWWIKQPLEIGAISSAVRLIAGWHDFSCFRASDPTKSNESRIVVVDSAEVELDEDVLIFRIQASHYLWRMVRRLAGTLVKLGLGEIRLQDFERLLAARPDPKLDVAAWTAPASGLFLERVRYP